MPRRFTDVWHRIPRLARCAKSGFLFPYEDWLSTPEWQAMFADALRDVPVPVESWYQRWAVFMFRHWQAISGAAA